jgi:O-methyltransferase
MEGMTMPSNSSYAQAINRNDRVGALYRAWGHVFSSQISGDYIEFGVYKGSTFIESYKIFLHFHQENLVNANSNERWRRAIAEKLSGYKPIFHGLDTFDGIPNNEEGNLAYAGGTYSASLASVQSRCVSEGLPEDCYRFYKGLFKDSAEAIAQSVTKAAIINIDGDLYESAVDSLEIAKPLIQVGTVLMFDDYNAFSANNSRGERKAFTEFQRTFPGKFEPWFPYMILGQSFLCVDSGAT